MTTCSKPTWASFRRALVYALFWGTIEYFASGVAHAAIVDFSAVMTDLKGAPLATSPTDKTSVTLRDVATTALVAPSLPDDKDVTGDEKNRRYLLAFLITNSKQPVDLSVENIALIKKLIGEAYGSMIVGPAWAILDPKPAEEMKK